MFRPESNQAKFVAYIENRQSNKDFTVEAASWLYFSRRCQHLINVKSDKQDHSRAYTITTLFGQNILPVIGDVAVSTADSYDLNYIEPSGFSNRTRMNNIDHFMTMVLTRDQIYSWALDLYVSTKHLAVTTFLGGTKEQHQAERAKTGLLLSFPELERLNRPSIRYAITNDPKVIATLSNSFNLR